MVMTNKYLKLWMISNFFQGTLFTRANDTHEAHIDNRRTTCYSDVRVKLTEPVNGEPTDTLNRKKDRKKTNESWILKFVSW